MVLLSLIDASIQRNMTFPEIREKIACCGGPVLEVTQIRHYANRVRGAAPAPVREVRDNAVNKIAPGTYPARGFFIGQRR